MLLICRVKSTTFSYEFTSEVRQHQEGSWIKQGYALPCSPLDLRKDKWKNLQIREKYNTKELIYQVIHTKSSKRDETENHLSLYSIH